MAASLYIGLMSGTSLDAVDCALFDFSLDSPLVATHSLAFPASLRADLLALCSSGAEEIERLGRCDRRLGETYAQAVSSLLAAAGLSSDAITAIGCHGQTIRHRPESSPGFTLQIGDANTVAELTGIAVVADFRRRDIAAGGQGAPLAPAYHHAAFRHNDVDRAIVNVGGMANVTLLRRSGPPIGYDTGPGSVLLDGWIDRHHGKAFDCDGAWARQGQIDSNLLIELRAHPFLAQPPPKSTGREAFNLAWLDAALDASTAQLSPVDVQATLLELTATSISTAIRKELGPGGELFLCGGGAHNLLLRERLQGQLPGIRVDTTAALGMPPDWVEAAAFAWLANQRLALLPGNLPSVTGAAHAVPLGAIYPGRSAEGRRG